MLSNDLRLSEVVEEQAADEADWEYGDASDIELLRSGMDSGCRWTDISGWQVVMIG